MHKSCAFAIVASGSSLDSIALHTIVLYYIAPHCKTYQCKIFHCTCHSCDAQHKTFQGLPLPPPSIIMHRSVSYCNVLNCIALRAIGQNIYLWNPSSNKNYLSSDPQVCVLQLLKYILKNKPCFNNRIHIYVYIVMSVKLTEVSL